MYRSLLWTADRTTKAFVGVTAAACGQAVYYGNTYVPLPELHATEAGRVLPLRERREKATEALRVHAERFRAEKQRIAERLRERQDELKQSLDDLRRRKPKRVLFVGDSLVSGVGGSSEEAARGPPLARRVSRLLADAYGVEVEWRALGETGSDVSVIRRKLLPQIVGEYDVVIIMVGLNDFKHLARGELWRTPWAFGRELAELVDEVKARTGGRVVLPAYPMAIAGVAEPLKSYMGLIAAAWDAQKKSIAAEGAATFVDVFSTDDDAGYTASDRVHPNEKGYELWSSHIASAIFDEGGVTA